jgi:hypothetical protein
LKETEMHNCPECGMGHDEPVVVEEAPAEAIEQTVEADVKIEEIRADTAVKIAKIEAGVAEDLTESRLAEMEGQIRGMREVLDRIAPPVPEEVPEAAPEPVVVVDDKDEEMPPQAEHHEPPEPKKSSSYFGF